jgi:hypothetical protein
VVGDDDLLIGKMVNPQNVSINRYTESFTYSLPCLSWKEWYLQKKRHLSVGTYYQTKTQIILGLLQISHILFWYLSIFLLFFVDFYSNNLFFVILACFFLRNSLNLFIFAKINQIHTKPFSIIYWVFFDFLYTIYFITMTSSLLLFKKKTKWKN